MASSLAKVVAFRSHFHYLIKALTVKVRVNHIGTKSESFAYLRYHYGEDAVSVGSVAVNSMQFSISKAAFV